MFYKADIRKKINAEIKNSFLNKQTKIPPHTPQFNSSAMQVYKTILALKK